MKNELHAFRSLRRLTSVGALIVLGCGHVGIDLDGDEAPATVPSTGGAGGRNGGPNATPDAGSPPEMRPDSGLPTDFPPVVTLDAGQSDAGQVDAGTMQDDDAGTPPAADAGDEGQTPTLCSPLCNCDTAAECDLQCTTNSCSPSCAAGSTCVIDVEAATVVSVGCADGASCTLTGASAPSVTFTCEGGGSCEADCQGAETCSLTCLGTSSCTLDCADAATCTIDCADLASCLVIHENTETTVTSECLVFTVCLDGDATACNQDCP